MKHRRALEEKAKKLEEMKAETERLFKEMEKEQRRQYYQKHRAEIREYQRQYRELHKEKMREYYRAYRAENAVKLNERSKEAMRRLRAKRKEEKERELYEELKKKYEKN